MELQVLHTPGHQHGGISLYDPENGALFSGDALTPTITFDAWLGYVVDARSYWETLQTISRLNVEALLPAHESIRLGGDAQAEVERHVDRFKRVASEILSILGSGDGLYLNEIADTVVHRVLFGRSDEATFTEVATVHSHLQKLIYDGKARLEKGKYLIQ